MPVDTDNTYTLYYRGRGDGSYVCVGSHNGPDAQAVVEARINDVCSHVVEGDEYLAQREGLKGNPVERFVVETPVRLKAVPA
jgi:hypothetical protein